MKSGNEGGGPWGTLEWGQLLLPGSTSRPVLTLVPWAKAGGLSGREWAGYGGCAFLQAWWPQG